jgi:HlyD family secretion protein
VGQQLATLDTASLEATLRQRQATLASAQLRLQQALDGESVTGASTGATGGALADVQVAAASVQEPAGGRGGATPTTTVPAPTPPSVAPTTTEPPAPAAPSADELHRAQQAVLDAQKLVTATRANAQQALDDATSLCADVSTGADAVQACQGALAKVQQVQQAVSDAQGKLADASDAYTQLVDAERAATPTTAPTTTPTTTPAPSTTAPATTPPTTPDGTGAGDGRGGFGGGGSGFGGGGSGSGSGASGSRATRQPSAEDLASYQAQVDAAQAAVTVAEQAIAQATITSPIAGTVTVVGLTAGAKVSAADAGAAIAIMGAGGYEVTTTVTVDELSSVAKGQPATLLPDGSATPVTGQVVAIGMPAGDQGSATTYPVTVVVTGDTSGLRLGGIVDVEITTKESEDVLAVPVSAVQLAGAAHVVRVLSGGTVTATPVQLGAVGSTWVEVTAGLQAGQEVVLADLGEPLPGSATASSNAGNGNRIVGPGGFPPGGATSFRPAQFGRG